MSKYDLELYEPGFKPDDPGVSRRIPETKLETYEAAAASAAKKVQQLQDQVVQATPKPGAAVGVAPLTYEEAVAIETQKDEMLERIAATQQRIADIRSRINEMLKGDGSAFAFAVDMKKKHFLKRAVTKVFGIEKPTELTYEMYLLALQVRAEIEHEQAESYTSGNWGSDDE